MFLVFLAPGMDFDRFVLKNTISRTEHHDKCPIGPRNDQELISGILVCAELTI